MRLMPFSLTMKQIRARTKTVTRRTGWGWLEPGTRLRAVDKAMGLKKGQRPKTLAIIEVVSVHREPLEAMCFAGEPEETAREGFPELSCEEFVAMFCKHMKCDRTIEVNRIEFRYVEETDNGPSRRRKSVVKSAPKNPGANRHRRRVLVSGKRR